jgi:DNA-binding MarR family transcriptional regulator
MLACVGQRAVLNDAEPGSEVDEPGSEVDGLGAALERFVASLSWKVASEVPSDLSRTGASTLKALMEDGPQRVTSLAAREPVAQPTMSMVIKRLEQRGLVQRTVDPEDARASLVTITEIGIETMRERAEARSRWFASRLAGLCEEDRRTVGSTLAMMFDKLA